jgi:hypothetical protein
MDGMGKKGGLAILIANKGSKKSEEADDGAALDAMGSFMQAVKDDDPEAALEEFRNLMDLCEGGE